MRFRLATTSSLLLLGLSLTACGDDSSSNSGTDTESSSSTAPTTDPTSGTNPTSTTNSATSNPTTDGPTTSSTTDATATDTEDPDTTGTTGEPVECPYTPIEGKQGVGLELVASGFRSPTLVVGDPVDTDIVYVLEQGGSIKRLGPDDDTAPAEDWFSVDVSSNSELGLLGMAFHPDYASNGLMYLLHSPSSDRWLVTEFAVVDGTVNAGSARDVFGTAQPAGNHNGGMIQFGPDGMLYVSVGDGGYSDDLCQNGQDTQTHHGSIVRIDVTADGTGDTSTGCGAGCLNCPTVSGFDYTVPKDNPFVDDPNVDDAIYAYGLRNPFRFSFDPEDGRLYAADVGQNSWEEVDAIIAGGNYGWNTMEGNHCFQGAPCDTSAAPGEANEDGMIAPITEYARANGNCSITGLGFYRSCEVPAFDGLYFYSDVCSGRVFAVSVDGDVINDLGTVAQIPDNQGAFGGGYNVHGDVFIAAGNYFAGGTTSVYRITAAQ